MSAPLDGGELAVFDRRAEVEALLREDTTLLGRYWGYLQEDLPKEQMAEREAIETTGWTSNYAFLLSVVRDGEVTTKPSVARGAAGRLRAWLRSKPLSEQLREEFTKQERVLAAVAEDRVAQASEDEEAHRSTVEAESANVPGIYVYTLPHYLRHPYEPDTGRTLLKVGHSAVDAVHRAGAQSRFTALPEDPVLLRVYPCAQSLVVERRFHAWLEDADHQRPRSTRAGREWFVTSTKFLDRVARVMDLEVQVVNELDGFLE
ncbi:GIY-YIG nuclease family protein [Nocardioides alcanivorans]|uniref:GIY-YIG nuclease family protein n=1 Tax=Nocardioides alcanivorans TaxID=2897352 RepID=UPI001F3D424C|nr:GIY-YIG nuclease family protein [Nocardioides alcanivorans]